MSATPKGDLKRLEALTAFMRLNKLLTLQTPDGYSLAMHEGGFTWPNEVKPESGDLLDEDGDGSGPRGFLEPLVETPQQRIRREMESAASSDRERGAT